MIDQSQNGSGLCSDLAGHETNENMGDLFHAACGRATQKREITTMIRTGLAALAAFVFVQPCAAQMAPDVQRGLVLARTHCAQCHSIDKAGPSPLAIAPPFRDLHKRYPVESLEEAFAEGISTGHPSMPQFHFEPDQITNLIAFLKSLE